MLTPKQMWKYGEVLWWALKTARKGRFKKGDIVLIRFDPPGVAMAEVLYTKMLQIGMNPVLRMGPTSGMELGFYQWANSKQLIFQAPGDKELFKNLNGSIYLHAPESLTHLSRIDPKKIGKALIARKPLRDILDKRDEKGFFGWTLCILPTPDLAKKAGLPFEKYRDQIVRACHLNKKDPVAEWQRIFKEAMIVKRWLNRMEVQSYHVESESIDLKITPGDKRRWVGVSGHNIPSFEIFLSPDWRGTEGFYYANQPSFRSGNYVEGAWIEFRKGIAVRTGAKKGREFIAKQLSMDKGASRVGEFSLTDKRFSKINKYMANTLFDENYGGRFGNCHLALGSSYSDTFAGDPSKLTKEKKRTLGFNDSALHWDLINTERKRVTALLKSGGKRVIYENGMFTY